MIGITIKKITGKIEVLTGLHIGGGTDAIEIGGIDNPVIKDPMTNMPLIPGSSIKGKIRSLLELKMGKINEGKPCGCGKKDCLICLVFGNTNKNSETGVSRGIFRDAFLSKESVDLLTRKNLMSTESKMENTIDRIKGTALHPRQSERVIPGLKFDFEISIRVFEGDGDKSIKLLKDGLAMLEKDTLGGSGSRGYGKIKFEDLKLDDEAFAL